MNAKFGHHPDPLIERRVGLVDHAASPRPRARAVPHWLRGDVSASPHGNRYVRVAMEREYGSVRAEVYLTRKQAQELLSTLDWTLNRADRG